MIQASCTFFEPSNAAIQLRVLLADDQVLFTDALSHALAGSGIVIVTVPSFDALIAELSKNDHGFDVVIMDLSLRVEHALTCLSILNDQFPETNVALMTNDARPEVLSEAMVQHGALGVIPRNSSLKSLSTAIRFIADGEPFVHASLLKPQVQPARKTGDLSELEQEIVKEMANGMSNSEIASALDLPEMTVKVKSKTIYRKLRAHNRTKAAVAARSMGYI